MGPDAAGRVLQVVHDWVQFLHISRAKQPMGEALVKFDPLLRKAEARMHPGGSFPPALASVLCLQNASHSRADKSLIGSSVHRSLGIVEVAKHKRRLFGPMGGGGRQGAPYPAEGESTNRTMRILNTGDKGQRKKKKAASASGGSEKLNRIHPRAGWRNRCVFRDSEQHLVPRRPNRARRSTGAVP